MYYIYIIHIPDTRKYSYTRIPTNKIRKKSPMQTAHNTSSASSLFALFPIRISKNTYNLLPNANTIKSLSIWIYIRMYVSFENRTIFFSLPISILSLFHHFRCFIFYITFNSISNVNTWRHQPAATYVKFLIYRRIEKRF